MQKHDKAYSQRRLFSTLSSRHSPFAQVKLTAAKGMEKLFAWNAFDPRA
jgi:hypothetical protein